MLNKHKENKCKDYYYFVHLMCDSSTEDMYR